MFISKFIKILIRVFCFLWVILILGEFSVCDFRYGELYIV